VLGKLARIADGVWVCASSAMNQSKGCLFGVRGAGMGDTWNTPLNGLEVGASATMENLFGSFAQRAAATGATLSRS
jgi:hypothetical protein